MAKPKTPTLGDFIGTGNHQFKGSLTDPNARHEAMPLVAPDRLERGRYQTRQTPDDEDLAELAQSITELGIIEPIVVRPLPSDSHYEILAGERRWRAAQLAGLSEVPVIVRDVNDRTALAITLVENLQREDLNPIEEAQGLQRLTLEFELTQKRVAELVGKTQSSISKTIGLLSLDPAVQSHIREGRLEAGHGKVLLNLNVPDQWQLADQAVQKAWSVRELESRKSALLAKREQAASSSESDDHPKPDPDLMRLQTRMQERLGAPVKFKYNAARGKGRIEIAFNSVEECDGILARLGFSEEDD